MAKIKPSRKKFKFAGRVFSYWYLKPAGPKKSFDSPIVFLHANGYAVGTYMYYARRLCKKREVYLLDMAGHGLTDPYLHFKTWDFHRDTLYAFLQHASIPPAIFIGHSMGGAIAIRLAIHKPEYFKKIIGLDPVLLGWLRTAYMKIWGNPLVPSAKKRRFRFENKQKAKRLFQKTPSGRKWHPEVFHDYIEYSLCTDKNGTRLCCLPEMEIKNFQSPDFKTLLTLPRLKTETHFLVPKKSHTCPISLAKKLAKKNPNSSVIEIPSDDHLFPFLIPEETLGFIQSVLS